MRARNLKPSFFTNETLAEIEPLGRILFAGLWCAADRSGRLEDRPKRLKAELLPYDECDVDVLLNRLDAAGFIKRYEVAGDRYIAVVNFAKHQNPHCKERESTIPAPCEHSAGPVQELDKHQTSTVQALESPERARLIPDSGFLIPEAPTASGAAVTADERSFPDRIFGDGLRFLVDRNVETKTARSFLGLMRKTVGDVVAWELLQEAERLEVSQPQEWLSAAMKRRKVNSSAPRSPFAPADRLVTLDDERPH